MVCGLILLPSELFQIGICCKNVNSLMKLKFIHEISVIQETFLVFSACPEGRIKLLRGPDPACGPRVVHPCNRSVANAVRAPSARVSASAPPYLYVWSRLSHCLYHLTHALFP